MGRLAVIVFNLGGPDRPEAIKPFLLNLFGDPAILGVPQPIRFFLARLIAAQRAKVAADIYARIGGRSPILPNTKIQAKALEAALAGEDEVGVFIAMRYWHPLARETAADVKRFAPDHIVLLPLYPQYSTATTESSLKDWHQAAASVGLVAPTRAICCYPTEPGFCGTLADALHPALAEAAKFGKPRVLFSAHGLPKRVVAAGDPYQFQVERTAAAIVAATAAPNFDWVVCYQSRVGRLEWIGPYAEDEIIRAGNDRAPIVVVPVSFVSEHSETLVELDMTYREHAMRHGVPAYFRVPTVAAAPGFIAGLAGIVRETLADPPRTRPFGGEKLCPATASRCGCAAMGG